MKQVYYIPQKYLGREKDAVNEAFRIMKFLRESGKVPFSPIAHTHFYHEYHKIHSITSVFDEDYVGWDLDICEALKPNLIMLFSSSCLKDGEWDSKGAKMEYDWANRNDVRIIWIHNQTFQMWDNAFYGELK